MVDERITSDVLEVVADHLSLDLDEVDFVESFQRPKDISGQWNECVCDLSHLSRDERDAVLQRTTEFKPRMVDGIAVHLFTKVQALKGQQRINAAIVDLGDRCLIASF